MSNHPTLTHFAPVTIELKIDGTLWVTYKGVLVLSNVQTRLPPLSGAKFGFGGRTGESGENIWLDNLGIQTYSAPRPLVFVTDAPTNLWVFEGQPATFRADLFGSEPIFIQWFSNNVAVAGATNSTYTTPPATLANNGDIYRIDASNAVNSISRSAMLGIQPVIFLSAGPTNQVVRTNQTATFRADLYGSPPIHIQWFSNNVPVLNATNSTHTTSPATAANNGDVYRIEASNSFSSTNRSATLTVLLSPVIVLQPQSQTNFAGDNVTFTVVVTNNATLPISYQWRKVSTVLTNITLNARTGSFTLFNVQTNVTTTNGPGMYRVAVMNAANPSPGLPSAFANLTVLSPPRLQLSASQVGTNFQLTATGTTNTNWRIESRDTVAGTNAWQPLTNITLGPSPAIIQQPFTATNHFYRGARLP